MDVTFITAVNETMDKYEKTLKGLAKGPGAEDDFYLYSPEDTNRFIAKTLGGEKK